ncbi:MAG: TIR domain-containing protein [Dysgonamonadaceae bacterium]
MLDKEVFVTYSWDDDNHCDKVISFTNFLRQSGFNAEIDQMLIQEETAINFKKMMHRAMTDYKKVVVILSKGYKEKAEAFKGGVGNEYELILNDIEENPNKYILVSLDGIKNNIIPLFFKGREIVDLSENTNEKQQKLFAKLQDIKQYQFADVSGSKPIIQQKVISDFIPSNNRITNIFKKDKNKSLSLTSFCQDLYTDSEVNILKLLKLSLSCFTDATKYIDDNPNDKKNGVIAVYIKQNLKLFEAFDSCAHKIYKNGDKQYFLYTTTTDIEQITNISNILYEFLGIGLYDNRVRYSFKDINQIENIANGFCSSVRDECQTMWTINNKHTLHLTYHINPLQQFVLSIDEKKIIDRPNISRNDSLLNYLNFDINKIIENSIQLYKAEEDGKIKYIDYNTDLPKPFLNIFTKVKIRIFGENKLFDSDIQTHLFFYTINNIIKLDDIKSITKQISSIYGNDNSNLGELEDYEINNINEFGSWSGRFYCFNSEHKLNISNNRNEAPMYDIFLNYDEFLDEGLKLSVIGFNDLVNYVNGDII